MKYCLPFSDPCFSWAGVSRIFQYTQLLLGEVSFRKKTDMKGHKLNIAQIKSQKSQSILLLLLYPTFANSARRSHGIMKIVVILCVSVRHLCGWGVDLKLALAFHQPLTRLAWPWNCRGLYLQVILARGLLACRHGSINNYSLTIKLKLIVNGPK